MTRRGLAQEIRAMGRPTATPEVSEVVAQMVAQTVARFIVARWEKAGVRGYALDEERRPVPAAADLAHTMKQMRSTGPDGEALFYCRLCGSNPSPFPPLGACRGEALVYAAPEIGKLLARGVLYAPRAPGGLPLPPPVAAPVVRP